MGPQIPLFSNFFIKNGSHDIIHTFKNYFITVFSVSAKISSIQTDFRLKKKNEKRKRKKGNGNIVDTAPTRDIKFGPAGLKHVDRDPTRGMSMQSTR